MTSWNDLAEIVRPNEPLAPHTWFRLGGPAQYFAEPRNVDELARLVRRCRDENVPLRLLGGGSNLLVGEQGVAGMVIHLAAADFTQVAVAKQTVTAGAGAKLGHVIASSVREGLAGLEALVGIPGSVGGALRGNAGGRGGDIGQWTAQVQVMNEAGEISQQNRDDLEFGYRLSSLDDLVILSAEFQLETDDPVELTKRMQKQWIIKKAGQPLAHQSAGCIFKNPRGMSAGILIDQAGLKGTRVGGAEVSPRHANFIVAEPGATAQDVQKLIETVRQRVRDRLGVELELEIQIW